MTGEKQPSKTRRNLERTLMGAGALLLLSFFLIKGWSASESRSGINAFEEARAAALQQPANAGELIDLEYAADSPVQHGVTPDTSLWSEQRIKDYQASVKNIEDAPQAVLSIDHLNIKVPVYDGASELNLNRGVARIRGTAQVGEGGNLGIAGHRDGFFRPLKDIKVGDSFQVETYLGTEDYRVSSIEIIDPTQLEVLAPTDAHVVTLVTCYPFYYVGQAPKRFIVRGEAITHQVNS